MSSNLRINLTGDPGNITRALAKAFRKAQAEIEKLNDKSAKGAKKHTKHWVESSKSFGDSIKEKVLPMLLGAGGVLSAYKLITAEIKAQITLQNRMADAQKSLAQAQQDVIRNMVGVSDQQVRGVFKSLERMASEVKVSQKTLSTAYASAFSASGGDIPAALGAVRTAAQFAADRPESIATIAGSLLDVSRITGTKDPEVNMGYLAEIGKQSRVTDPTLQARNIPRAIIGGTSLGFGAGGAGALFTALTTATGEFTGEASGTAGIALQSQLKKFHGKRGQLMDVEGRQLPLEHLIAEMQKYPGMQKEFFKTATFEKKFEGVMAQLLTDPESDVSQTFFRNLAAIPTEGQARATGKDVLRRRGLAPAEGTAELMRSFQVMSEQLMTGDVGGGRAGAVRTGLQDILKSAGMGVVGQKIAGLKWEFGTRMGRQDTLTQAMEILQGEAGNLRSGRGAGGGMYGLYAAGSGRAPTAEEGRRSDILWALADHLREIQRSNNRIADNTRGRMDDQGPAKDPGAERTELATRSTE